MKIQKTIYLSLLFIVAYPSLVSANHFKGLPHYNYFENYPQVPEEEFLGQKGDYEFSLVAYDFQGIQKENTEQPDNVRLYLVIYNLRGNSVYKGPATLEILDGSKVVASRYHKSSELENLYSMHRSLPETGDYSLRITLHGEGDLATVIPFRLSSQKVHWGKWVSLALIMLIGVAAVGARKKRVAMDRRARAAVRQQKEGEATGG